MELLRVILISICCLALLLCFYMLYRNQKVYDVRQYFLWKTNDYDKLPLYDEMMYSFTPMTKKYWLKWIKENS